MGLDINLNTSKIDISEEDGLNVDLYNDNIDISDDEADDIIIEITGLKSINKFIGLEDTPLYYDNGKFFKVEDNKIVYADIQWKDISGDISESPEIVSVISDLVNEVASDIIDERINLHNLNEEAHPYIQDIIKQNYNTLNTKINDTKEELSEALNAEITNRETADNELSESIQQETLARIEADTTLQNNIYTLTNNLNTEIENRTNADNLLRDDIDSISGELAQEIIDRQTQDNLLQEQITYNYNTLDNKIDTEISDRISADTTLQNNINELTQTVEDNNTAVNNRIDETNDTVSDLSNTVTSNYNTLNDKIDTEISNRTSADTILQNNINAEALARQNADVTLQDNIDALSDTVSDNYTDLDGKISDLTDTVNNNDTAINNKVDGINTTLTTSINNLSNTVSSNYTTLDTKIDNTKNALDGDISDLSDTVTSNYNALDARITTNESNIATNAGNITTINSKIPSQASSSNQLADKEFVNSSIATNTANFIGTFNSVTELEAYSDTITNNDYAFVINTVITDNGNDWSSFASLDARSKTDLTNFDYAWIINGAKFDIYRFDIVNQEWLLRASNINKEDVSLNDVYNRYKASVSGSTVTWDFEYTLNNSSFTAEQWSAINSGATSTNIGQITINANNIADLQTNKQDILTAGANIQINNNVISATDTTYTAGSGISIENNIISNTQTSAIWGNIQGTLSDQIDLQNALNSKYDASNPDGYITSADLPTNYVTTNTAQNISGRKTFLGEKAIYFKQNATADKLGFTLYNPNNSELGALEYRPNTINGNALLALNCSQSGSNYVGFRYWSGINIVAPRPTTNGNYYIPVNVTDGTNTVTANNNGTLNISTLLPDVSNFVTNSSLATTLADYQPLLVSGTNIKTINNNSILGSGNLTLDGLPSQTGQAGKFLTTNGTEASWANTTKITVRDWSVS